MTITLDLAPELEQQIQAAAAQAGLAPDTYIAEALRQQLRGTSPTRAPHVSARESELLLTINQSLSAITWTRYHELVAKRQAHLLTSAEQAELIGLTDRIEQANVARIAAVAELAQMRNTTLDTLFQTLGLTIPSHA